MYQQEQDKAKLQMAECVLKNKLQHANQYPYNSICFIRIKLDHLSQQPNKNILKVNGTGCLINQNLLLTAAHNLYQRDVQLKKFSNLKKKVEDNSYVAHISQQHGQKYQYQLKEIHQSQHFSLQKQNYRNYDYSIIQLQPKKKQEHSNKQFMPIVVIMPENVGQLTSIQISGYSIDILSKISAAKIIKSKYLGSSCMAFQSDSEGKIKEFKEVTITYDIPTMEGLSGSPIFAQYHNQKIIIGIHTGKQKIDKPSNSKYQEHEEGCQSSGIAACNMIEQLNQLGYKLYRKPLVYTQKTFRLRKKDWMSSLHDLLLMDRMYGSMDILVYTAFDLTNLKRICLGGNIIGNTGVQYLLRRSYPNLESLYLTSNKIDDLSKVPQKNWLNISKIKTLSFNHNQLTGLPQCLASLSQISRFWIIENYLRQIPRCLVQFSKRRQQDLTVFVYKNKILFEQQTNKMRRQQILKSKSIFVWQRQNNNK